MFVFSFVTDFTHIFQDDFTGGEKSYRCPIICEAPLKNNMVSDKYIIWILLEL